MLDNPIIYNMRSNQQLLILQVKRLAGICDWLRGLNCFAKRLFPGQGFAPLQVQVEGAANVPDKVMAIFGEP